MQILDASGTAQALPYAQLVTAIAAAARQRATQKIHAPERFVVPIDASNTLLCMPAIGVDIGVTKLLTVHPNNARIGAPTIQGEVIVFDTATGRRLLILDGPTVTARRTAAVTLLGIQRLASGTPSSVLLIGTGVQAAWHADALAEFFGVQTFWVAGLNLDMGAAFCEALRARRPQVHATPVALASFDCHKLMPDLVISLTTSRTPIIPADIPARTLAIGVGAFKPDMAEFPASLLHSRPIVVDDLAGAKHEAGDLIQAGVEWSKVRDLAQVLDQDRDPSSPIPVFKTVGQAAWDLAAARVALQFIAK